MNHEQLVEWAAHRIWHAANFHLCGGYELQGWVKLSDAARRPWLEEARAILSLIADALGEPTEGMRNAAMGPDDGSIHGSRKMADYVHQAKWSAMLDASPLKGPKP